MTARIKVGVVERGSINVIKDLTKTKGVWETVSKGQGVIMVTLSQPGHSGEGVNFVRRPRRGGYLFPIGRLVS